MTDPTTTVQALWSEDLQEVLDATLFEPAQWQVRGVMHTNEKVENALVLHVFSWDVEALATLWWRARVLTKGSLTARAEKHLVAAISESDVADQRSLRFMMKQA